MSPLGTDTWRPQIFAPTSRRNVMSPLDIASQRKLEANHLADNRVDVLDPP